MDCSSVVIMETPSTSRAATTIINHVGGGVTSRYQANGIMIPRRGIGRRGTTPGPIPGGVGAQSSSVDGQNAPSGGPPPSRPPRGQPTPSQTSRDPIADEVQRRQQNLDNAVRRRTDAMRKGKEYKDASPQLKRVMEELLLEEIDNAYTKADQHPDQVDLSPEIPTGPTDDWPPPDGGGIGEMFGTLQPLDPAHGALQPPVLGHRTMQPPVPTLGMLPPQAPELGPWASQVQELGAFLPPDPALGTLQAPVPAQAGGETGEGQPGSDAEQTSQAPVAPSHEQSTLDNKLPTETIEATLLPAPVHGGVEIKDERAGSNEELEAKPMKLTPGAPDRGLPSEALDPEGTGMSPPHSVLSENRIANLN